jgi:hypothetical protein
MQVDNLLLEFNVTLKPEQPNAILSEHKGPLYAAEEFLAARYEDFLTAVNVAVCFQDIGGDREKGHH